MVSGKTRIALRILGNSVLLPILVWGALCGALVLAAQGARPYFGLSVPYGTPKAQLQMASTVFETDEGPQPGP
jgi:hypothetical protein